MVETFTDVADKTVQQVGSFEDLAAQTYDKTTGHPVTDSYIANTSASIKKVADVNTDTYANLTKSQKYALESGGPDAVLQEAVSASVRSETEDLVALAKLEQNDDITNVVAESVINSSKRLHSNSGLEESFQETFNLDVREAVRKEQAFKEYGAYTLAQAAVDRGVIDTVLDFGAILLIPGLEAYKEFAIEKDLGIENFEELVNTFHTLDIEQKKLIFPTLASEIRDSVGNDLIAVAAASELLGISDDFSFDVTLSKVDLATLGLVGAYKAVKGLSLVRRLSKAGAKGEAAEIIAEVSDDITRVDDFGIDLVDAQGSASAFRMEEFAAGAADDIAAAVDAEFKARKGEIDKAVNSITFSRRGILNVEEQAKLQTKLVDEFENTKIKLGLEDSNTELVNVSGDGTRLKATIMSNGKKIDNIEVVLTGNDLDNLQGHLRTGAVKSWLQSPSAIFRDFKEDFVGTATVLGFRKSNTVKKFAQAHKAIFKGLNKKELGNVDAVLLQGDKDGVVYNLNFLVNTGVETPSGTVRLSTKEAASYAAAREMFDTLLTARNLAERRALEFDNYRYLPLKDGGDAVLELYQDGVFVKNTDELPRGVTRAYNTDFGRIEEVSDAMRKQIQDGTYIVVRSRDDLRIKMRNADGSTVTEATEYALVRADDLEELPLQIINPVRGYVPRIRPEVNVVVRSGRKILKNGEEVTRFQTERLFSRIDEADAWAAEQRLKEPNVPFEVDFDSKLMKADPEFARDMELVNYGGLYKSGRSRREILFGYVGNQPNTLSATESMERMMSNVAAVGNMTEFRLQMERKFLNTYGDFLTNKNDWASAVIEKGADGRTLDPGRRAAIERLQGWMKAQFGMRTQEENLWRDISLGTAQFIEGIPNSANSKLLTKIHQGSMSISTKDPFMLARAASFHTLLGAFNPAQLVVQAMGASIAMTANPLRAPAAFRTQQALRAAMWVAKANNVEGVASISEKLWKVGGFKSAADMRETVTALEKSGLLDSIRMNADYEAAVKGMPYSKGAVRRALGKVGDKSLMFFQEGETFTRLFGWSMALEDWRKANPGKVFSARYADDVTKRSLDYTLNLNSANKAVWQDGLLSIPTQYLQITTKFMEAMLGNKLTAGQKMRIVGGQMALFGAAGVPFVGTELARRAGEFFYEDANLTEEQKAAIDGGVTGWLTQWVVGDALETSRFAIAPGLEQLVDMFSDNSKLSDVVFGAFGSTADRTLKALRYTAVMASVPETYNWDSGVPFKMLEKYGNIFSSFSNANKAWYAYHSGTLRDSSGKPLFFVDGEDTLGLVLAKSLGLTSLREKQLWDSREFLFRSAEDRQEVSDRIGEILVDYVNGEHTEEDSAIARSAIAFLTQGMSATNQQKVIKSAWDRYIFASPQEMETLKKVYNEILAGTDLSSAPTIAKEEE